MFVLRSLSTVGVVGVVVVVLLLLTFGVLVINVVVGVLARGVVLSLAVFLMPTTLFFCCIFLDLHRCGPLVFILCVCVCLCLTSLVAS